MAILTRLAHSQNRRDEALNVALAKELAAARDKAGIRELAKNLWNDDAEIQSDCVKVLYEVGALEPELIAGYTSDFIKLLGSKQPPGRWARCANWAPCAARSDRLGPGRSPSSPAERQPAPLGYAGVRRDRRCPPQRHQGLTRGRHQPGAAQSYFSLFVTAPGRLPAKGCAAAGREDRGSGGREQARGVRRGAGETDGALVERAGGAGEEGHQAG